MITRLYLTPADHGRELTVEEYDNCCDAEEGWKYELVDGRLDVSPMAGFPHFDVLRWLFLALHGYSEERPDITNYVSFGSRVFVPGRRTRVEPDLCAYRDFPVHLPATEVNWRDVLPILVVEVLSPDTAEKDLERNRDIYLQVPSIREYWILDTREDFDHPSLIVLRRRGARWTERVVAAGETYETALLPGLALLVAPRAA